jgi:hypothetical protein
LDCAACILIAGDLAAGFGFAAPSANFAEAGSVIAPLIDGPFSVCGLRRASPVENELEPEPGTAGPAIDRVS